jgi:hypothetical protein
MTLEELYIQLGNYALEEEKLKRKISLIIKEIESRK